MGPADQDLRTITNTERTGAAGPRIGVYRLIRELGHGGMGTVFLAVRDDDAFQKRVAIKILKRGMDSDAIVRRFRNERQILAGLDHPHIAGLLDGGTTPDGLPYFTMEYVEGQTIVEYCELRQLKTTARLQLFRKVCSAVQYAHQNLIIHRDLKPANVLVTADGTPKLLDFGIAKLLNPEIGGQTLAPTAAGLQLMTPEYASPEQVRGDVVTTATDVYSLGVLLYELLTGRRPYRLTSRTPAEIARVVCEAVPERPSTAVTRVPTRPAQEGVVTRNATTIPAGEIEDSPLRPATEDPDRLRRRLAGDLDNIVLKALSKEPGRRYASVDQFSEDIRRHLAGLPVIARPDTWRYRTTKFVRRNRAVVTAGSLVVLALVAGIIGTTWQAREARRERQRAEQRFNDVRKLANSLLFELHDSIRDLPGATPARKLMVTRALEYLDNLAREAGDRADLQRELAGAYIKVGDVQGRPFNPNLGDTAGALASYQKATALYEALGAGGSASPALSRELGTAYLRMSDILSSTGRTSDALAYANKGLALAKSIGSDASASPDARRELVASYTRVGDMLSATGDTNAALELRRTALAMMEALSAADPKNVSNIRQLAIAYQKLGNQLGNPNYPNIGDTSGALRQLERSAAVLRQATIDYPDNAMFRRNLSVAESNLADVLFAMNRTEEALAKQRQVLETGLALSAADPTNVTARNDVAISRSKIGEMLVASGRSREAVQEFEEALEIHLNLSAADPTNNSFKLEIASDYNRLATAQANIGDRISALANHGRAVALSRDLSAANAGSVELRFAVGLALTGRGDAYLRFAKGPSRRADLAAAERDYAEAVNVVTALERKQAIQGTDVELLEKWRTELARIRREIGRTPPPK
jgi:non-specific serine/threonine protein kinase/serine/threonine-protein kinase